MSCFVLSFGGINEGGLLFKMSDGNMQYVTSTSFLLLTYAKYLTSADKVVNCGGATITPTSLRSIARKQVITIYLSYK